MPATACARHKPTTRIYSLRAEAALFLSNGKSTASFCVQAR